MMPFRPARVAAALAMVLTALQPDTAVALGDTHIEPLWLRPASSSATGPIASNDTLAPLLLPSGWSLGDAAAVIVSDRPGMEEGHRRVVAALIEEGAAVLEIDWHMGRGRAPHAASTPQDLVPNLFGALLALRRDAGAGLMVALGYGAGGPAALLAAQEDVAVPHLGPAGPRFVAAAALGPGRPAFAAGAAPPAEEGWPTRAPLLCKALAGAAEAGRAEAERDCIAGLEGAAQREQEPRPAPLEFRQLGSRW